MIGSGYGLVPIHLQPIARTKDDLLSTTPLGMTLNRFVIEIQIFSFQQIHLKGLLHTLGYFAHVSMHHQMWNNMQMRRSWSK